jgi:hypothetical protein
MALDMKRHKKGATVVLATQRPLVNKKVETSLFKREVYVRDILPFTFSLSQLAPNPNHTQYAPYKGRERERERERGREVWLI